MQVAGVKRTLLPLDVINLGLDRSKERVRSQEITPVEHTLHPTFLDPHQPSKKGDGSTLSYTCISIGNV